MRRRLVLVAAVLVVGCAGAGALFASDPVQRVIQDRLYDNVPSGVACERLPKSSL